MCKTCGCAGGGAKKIEMNIQCDELGRDKLKRMLMGLPGVLHVQSPSGDKQWIVDFDPRHLSEEAIQAEVKKVADITAITEYHHHFHWNFFSTAKIPRVTKALHKYLSK